MRKHPAVTAAAILCLSVSLFTPLASFGQARVEPVQRPAAPETLAPSTPFDAGVARQAVERGSSTIRGTACTYHDNLMFVAANRSVYLLPVTPHLDEWLQLRKKSRRHPIAPLAKEVFETRVETGTDEKGRFAFPNMKPGRYYLAALMSFNQAKSRDVYSGSGYNAFGGGTDYYKRENYAVGRDDLLEQTVEIKHDGQTVSTTLRNSGFWNKGGLLGKLLPCM